MAQFKTALTRRTENQLNPNIISSITHIIFIISGIAMILTSLYLLMEHLKKQHQGQSKLIAAAVLLLIAGLELILSGIRRGAKRQQSAE
jgi:hypothetical protein